jgi:hypothetical protein
MSAVLGSFSGCVADGGGQQGGVVVVEAGDGVARLTGVPAARLMNVLVKERAVADE